MINNEVIKNADSLRKLFLNAKPFPYVVIDNFFKEDVFNKLLSDFEMYYDSNQNKGKSYSTDVEQDKWTSQGNKLSCDLENVADYLQSDTARDFLKSVTGFKVLNTSNYNGENLGFFHYMRNNAYLGPHIDHMVDMDSEKVGYHVLNIIIYITKEWNPNWGGNTFFMHKNDKTFTDVEFRPNRAVIFMHSPISVHGTSRVLNTSENKRISIYFDYYSNEKNPYEHLGFRFRLHDSPHLFFLPRFSDYFLKKNRKYLNHFASHYKNKFLAMLRL